MGCEVELSCRESTVPTKNLVLGVSAGGKKVRQEEAEHVEELAYLKEVFVEYTLESAATLLSSRDAIHRE